MLSRFVVDLAKATHLIPVFRASLRQCVLLCLLAGAASAQYRFDHWTAETGLPQNIVTGIHQTPEGYLWVTTLDGLARFDGVRFAVFNKSNTPGISSNRFTCLYQDARGELWAGTEVGVVTRYHQGQFTAYATEHGLPKSFVFGLTGDAQGRVWVLSDNKLREWEPAAGKFVERESPPFSGSASRLGWKAGGGFCSFGQAGLHLFVSGDWTHLALPAAVERPITRVAQADDGAIWIAGAGARLFRLRDGNVTVFPLHRKSLGAARPLTEWRDRAGKIWELEVTPDLSRKLTIPSSGQATTLSLNTIYEDRDGNLWLGTDGQGLYRIRKQVVTTYSKEQGLAGRNVYPVCEDRTGAIWAGTWDGGLSRIKDGEITTFTTREGLSAGVVNALYADRDGRLWIATSSDLQIYEQGRFTSVKAEYMMGQVSGAVIFQDRTGAMWFGAERQLIRYRNGQLQSYTMQDGLPGETPRAIIDAAAGGVWMGFYGGLMHWREGRMTTWKEADGLPGDTVRALYEDQDGVLWIGTYDSGLGRFKDGKFTRYTTREGLFNDGVFQILEDAYGNLWMSSNRGIYRVRKQELNEFATGGRRDITSIAFGKNDGMRNVECNGGLWPAGVRARDGRLWFPTQDGVAMIDPKAVTMNQKPPPVLIEAVLLDRTPVAFRDEVRLQPGTGNLEIQYTALSFDNAAWTRFKYKIEGLDHDWTEAGTQRTAFFSYLPPGSYTFKVIAANSDGVWNTQGQSLRIIALPPFYRTWWFLGLIALAVAGAAFLAYDYRIRQLTRRQEAQQEFSRRLIESQEAERKRIAAELHDSLSQSLVIIKNRALLSLQQPGDEARTSGQLEEIVEATGEAIDEVKEIAYALRPFHLDRLGLAQAIEVMLERIEETSGLRFTTEFDPLDGLFSPEVEINLYRIVQECANNIVKHAQATDAKVSIKKATDKRGARAIIVKIEDNGRGFTPGASNHAGREANGGDKLRRGGFGLSGLNERARIIGGQMMVDSAPGCGTTIAVKLMVPEEKT